MEVTDKLTADLRIHFESLEAKSPDIQVSFVDRIQRDPNTMGKLKLVESKTKGRSS
jgi:hypothetical protein